MMSNTNPFPPPDEAEWRRRVERALDGRPFESLISTTFEGLKIAPLYPRATPEGARALRQKPGAWTIFQRMDHPEPETANAMAKADLGGGADALALTVSGAFAARGFGVRIEGESALDAALAEIDLDRVALRLDAGGQALDLAAFFASIARRRRLTSAALHVDFSHDPTGEFARSGRSPADPARGLPETHALLRNAGFAGHLLLADGRPYHEAGAGEAQELACVLATGVEYLRLLEACKLSLEEARDEIAFLLTADADECLCLPKFRALRLLWARVEDACGLAPKAIHLHAETAFRMMTRYDPWVNILRTTTGAFCAALAGADAITVLPFTLARGLPDEFARRIARNTQSILIHEANLATVSDPAAGAGSFEALTNELCTQAWRLFQNFEAQGGMLKSLQAGAPQREIGAAAAARREAIAHRALAITGTSAFALLTEASVPVLAPAPAQAFERREEQNGGLLRSQRDAEPYERLRAESDEHFRTTGERPKIFAANLGEPSGFATALASAANFFATAGIETLSGGPFETAVAAASAFRGSGCRLAFICAPQTVSTLALSETASALRAAGAVRVYLTGRESGAAAIALAEVTVNDLICARCDALAILQEAASLAMNKQPSYNIGLQ
ncbi:MAG TPA: methylmalonyl-CoA mutase family protein [Methylocella sp.]|nr:methylmalonyl-CoA mutase family protein [Methylocella sp.]